MYNKGATFLCVCFQRFNLGAQLYYKVMESMLKSVSLIKT